MGAGAKGVATRAVTLLLLLRPPRAVPGAREQSMDDP